MTEAMPDVDGCANEVGATNDICVVEMLQPTHSPAARTASYVKLQNNSNSSSSNSRRRRSVGGKCIWPASDWLRKLRNNNSNSCNTQHTQQQPPPLPQLQLQDEQELQEPRQTRNRRSSVLLMVLLSGAEMEAKAVVVSEHSAAAQPQRLRRSATDDMEEAIDALWL
ncbi:uncharacterized protein LOC117134789 [Drosophila busckii]|uniref:uncharacterized protein LOC117134789 n=1 Tax=Drosophila busckii TaxID=30019 RepID=UPI0014329C1D|nr:uncharacterized protein LOC117134789 [Drosophila busckii]